MSIAESISAGALWLSAARWMSRATTVVGSIVLARLLSPADYGVVAIAASVLALITGLASIVARPRAYRTSYALESQAAAQFDLKKMSAGEFLNMEGSDYTFMAKAIDLDRGIHKDVFLHKLHPDTKRIEIIVAEEAEMPTLNPGKLLQATFYNGYSYLLDLREEVDVTMQFKEMIVELPANEAVEKYRRKAETTLKLSQSDQPKDIAEYQWRITTPLATILLALIAVPLARTAPRESRFRNFAIALGVYIALFSIVSVLRTLMEQDKVGEFPGLWGAYAAQTVVLLLLLMPPRRKRQ